jgi:hypothetical protein
MTLVPLVARAQTAAPPLGPGGAPAGPKAAPAQEGPTRFTLGLSAEERWEDNPGFVTEGVSSFVSRAGLDFSRTWRSARGQLVLRGDGEASEYHSLPDLSRFSYGGALTGDFRVSPRFTIAGEQTYAVSNALEAASLRAAGLLLPQVRTETLSSRASFTALPSSQTTFTGEARYDLFRFDSDALVDGEALVGGATFTHQLGSRTSVGLSYTFVDNETGGAGSQVHSLRSVWSARLGPHWEAGASAGFSRLTQPGALDAVWNPSGGVDFTGRYPHSEYTLRYAHAISQAFGLGRERVLDLVSASISRRLSERVSVRADGSYALSRDPGEGDAFRIRTVSGSGSLRVTLTRALGLTIGGGVDRSSEPVGAVVGGPPVRTADARVGLVWARAWQ